MWTRKQQVERRTGSKQYESGTSVHYPASWSHRGCPVGDGLVDPPEIVGTGGFCDGNITNRTSGFGCVDTAKC